MTEMELIELIALIMLWIEAWVLFWIFDRDIWE